MVNISGAKSARLRQVGKGGRGRQRRRLTPGTLFQNAFIKYSRRLYCRGSERPGPHSRHLSLEPCREKL